MSGRRPKIIDWPATADELTAAGWRNRGSGRCASCGRPITWALTPAGRWAPLELIEDPDGEVRRYQSHFATCVDAVTHRRRAAARKDANRRRAAARRAGR